MTIDHGVELDMIAPPSTDQLFAVIGRHGQVPFDEIRRHEGGRVYAVERQFVEEADPASAGRLELMPVDVHTELCVVANEKHDLPPPFTHRLCGRRMRDVQNSMYRHLPVIRRRHPHNPAFLHPDDIAALGVSDGARVRIRSAHGSITAALKSDDTV